MCESTIVRPECVDEGVRRRIQAEYLEMPGLKLTSRQAARLWQLDAATSTSLLESMVADGVLRRSRDGAYVLLSDR